MSRLRIRPEGLPQNFNKIPAIKAVRNLTGIGLKEAKDSVEEAMTGAVVVIKDYGNHLGMTTNGEAFTNLKEQGMELIQGTTKTEFILEAAKEAAKLAADEGEEKLAALLLEVIAQHKENVAARDREILVEQEELRIQKHAEIIRREEIAVLCGQQDQRFHEAKQRDNQRFQMENTKDPRI